MARMAPRPQLIKQGRRLMTPGQLLNTVLRARGQTGFPQEDNLRLFVSHKDIPDVTGANVNVIKDGSQSAFDMAFANGTKAILDGAELGGSPMISTHGAFGKYASAAGNTWNDVIPSARATIMCVLSVNSVLGAFGAPDYVLNEMDTGEGPWLAVRAGPVIRFRWVDGGGTKEIDAGIELGQVFVVTARADGTNLRMELNNDVEQTPVPAGDLLHVDGRVEQFADMSDAGQYDGEEGFALIWDGALSDLEVAQAKAALKAIDGDLPV